MGPPVLKSPAIGESPRSPSRRGTIGYSATRLKQVQDAYAEAGRIRKKFQDDLFADPGRKRSGEWFPVDSDSGFYDRRRPKEHKPHYRTRPAGLREPLLSCRPAIIGAGKKSERARVPEWRRLR
jgi:hypothetical protein